MTAVFSAYDVALIAELASVPPAPAGWIHTLSRCLCFFSRGSRAEMSCR